MLEIFSPWKIAPHAGGKKDRYLAEADTGSPMHIGGLASARLHAAASA
jgi:hypothetical protein